METKDMDMTAVFDTQFPTELIRCDGDISGCNGGMRIALS